MTRVVPVLDWNPDESDLCMMCDRRAIGGRGFARFCDRHERSARPTENRETADYYLYRKRVRGEE